MRVFHHVTDVPVIFLLNSCMVVAGFYIHCKCLMHLHSGPCCGFPLVVVLLKDIGTPFQQMIYKKQNIFRFCLTFVCYDGFVWCSISYRLGSLTKRFLWREGGCCLARKRQLNAFWFRIYLRAILFFFHHFFIGMSQSNKGKKYHFTRKIICERYFAQ